MGLPIQLVTVDSDGHLFEITENIGLTGILYDGNAFPRSRDLSPGSRTFRIRILGGPFPAAGLEVVAAVQRVATPNIEIFRAERDHFGLMILRVRVNPDQ